MVQKNRALLAGPEGNKTFGLASAAPTQTGKGLSSHKEYKITEYLEGGIKLFCMQFQGLREASEKFISTRKNISSLCKLDLLQISDLLH